MKESSNSVIWCKTCYKEVVEKQFNTFKYWYCPHCKHEVDEWGRAVISKDKLAPEKEVVFDNGIGTLKDIQTNVNQQAGKALQQLAKDPRVQEFEDILEFWEKVSHG